MSTSGTNGWSWALLNKQILLPIAVVLVLVVFLAPNLAIAQADDFQRGYKDGSKAAEYNPNADGSGEPCTTQYCHGWITGFVDNGGNLPTGPH